MVERSYKQFCPVAMAAEILCTRWTVLVLRELLAGSTRFNDLRRGLPRMSPALLSQRLKELEEAGIVAKVPVDREPGVQAYALTPAGKELQPLIEGFGKWGQRWISSKLSLQQLDASLLMWDMRRNLNFDPLPSDRRVIQFLYVDAPKNERSWWLIVAPECPVDLCSIDPGFDVDLYVSSSLKAMTAIWMGHDNVRAAREDERILLTGDDKLASTMEQWLMCSPFAKEEPQVA